MSTLTMAQAASMLGLPKPAAHRQRQCAECDGELTWTVEITGSRPWGTGFDVLACEECDAEAERHWAGW